MGHSPVKVIRPLSRVLRPLSLCSIIASSVLVFFCLLLLIKDYFLMAQNIQHCLYLLICFCFFVFVVVAAAAVVLVSVAVVVASFYCCL